MSDLEISLILGIAVGPTLGIIVYAYHKWRTKKLWRGLNGEA
jgi:hypothetical protein